MAYGFMLLTMMPWQKLSGTISMGKCFDDLLSNIKNSIWSFKLYIKCIGYAPTYNPHSSWVVYMIMNFPVWNILMILSAPHVFKTIFCRLYLAISDKTPHNRWGDRQCGSPMRPIFADHDLKTDSFEVVLLKIMISAHLSLYPKAIIRIKI